MRLDINLATHRYEDAGRFWLRWGAGLGILAIATLALVAITISGLYDARIDHKKIAELQAKIAERDHERASAEAMLNRSENRSMRDKSQYLNELIARKAFSWTKAFEDLEKVMPPRLHDWNMFIRPAELERMLEQHGLQPAGVTGLKPRANPLRVLRALRRRKRGLLSYAEAVERMDLGESSDVSISYIGYARKFKP